MWMWLILAIIGLFLAGRFFRHLITFAGVIFIGITAFVMIAAINSQTNLLFWAFGLMLGGLIVSGSLSSTMLRKVDVRRVMSDHAIVAEPLEFHYLLTNRKRSWPSFAIQVTEAKTAGELAKTPEGYAFHMAPGQTITAMTQLIAARRGLITLNEIRLTCSFPFGFLTGARHILRPQSIVIYPRIGVLSRKLALQYRQATSSGSMTSNVRGGNDEFYGLREYRAGDNIHAIHWKRTARTGELMIREMASNAPPQMVIVLNLRAWNSDAGDRGGAPAVSRASRPHRQLESDLVSPDLNQPPLAPDPLENAIELAASLVCYGALENFAVGLALPGLPNESIPIPLMGREARQRHLYRLAVLNPADIRPDRAFPMPNRLGRRAEWIIVTLRRSDNLRDLIPPGASHTTLALDDPDFPNWLHFLSTSETRRLLREPPPRPN